MSLPRPPMRPVSAQIWRKPAIIVGLVLIAAALGFASTRRGLGGPTGPVAVAAPELSASPTEVATPEPSEPAQGIDWGQEINRLDRAIYF